MKVYNKSAMRSYFLLVATAAALVLVSACGGGGHAGTTGEGGSTGAMQWVGTWTASPYPVPSGNLPPASLSNSVLRQVVHVSLGGSQIRLQFSNLAGDGPVTINSAHVALCKATPAVDSTIDRTTDKALAFSGAASVTIPQGKVGTTGTSAQARFARDVLGQSGVRYVIIFDGVNDIGGGASFASMMPVYASLISQAHAKGLLIYGATITPFGTNSYYTVATESVRQQVNAYIKSGVFDGFLDFDAAVTNNGSPPSLQAQYDTWAQTDGLHLNPAGYQQLANSVNLTLFTK